MTIDINEVLKLELIKLNHAQELYELAEANRYYLAQWLTWVPYMDGVQFMENFIKDSMKRNSEGFEYAFVIKLEEKIVGRIGFFKIDLMNKIAEIGYWIGEKYEGKGIVKKSCERCIEYGFRELDLNRIEIKCAVDNHKSRYLPEGLNFTKEGILRQAEYLNNKFQDLYLFSLLKSEFNSKI